MTKKYIPGLLDMLGVDTCNCDLDSVIVILQLFFVNTSWQICVYA